MKNVNTQIKDLVVDGNLREFSKGQYYRAFYIKNFICLDYFQVSGDKLVLKSRKHLLLDTYTMKIEELEAA